jgi:hypothetical protein
MKIITVINGSSIQDFTDAVELGCAQKPLPLSGGQVFLAIVYGMS